MPGKGNKPGKLGTQAGSISEDKHLSEITALIDPRQFDLITKPTSGLVVIQGGAGSGKTTIGLHRLAYLAFQDPARFRADQMLVIVFNDALARYISRVLPALGVGGVQVITYEKWASTLRQQHVQRLPRLYSDDTPPLVTRLKKHPTMLRVIDAHAEDLERRLEKALKDEAQRQQGGARVLERFRDSSGRQVGMRIEQLLRFISERGNGADLPLATRHGFERVLGRYRTEIRDVAALWAEILTNRSKLREIFDDHGPGALSDDDLDAFVRHRTRACPRCV